MYIRNKEIFFTPEKRLIKINSRAKKENKNKRKLIIKNRDVEMIIFFFIRVVNQITAIAIYFFPINLSYYNLARPWQKICSLYDYYR